MVLDLKILRCQRIWPRSTEQYIQPATEHGLDTMVVLV